MTSQKLENSPPVAVAPDGREAGAAVDGAGGVGFLDLQEDTGDAAGLGGAAEGGEDGAGEPLAAVCGRRAHAVDARPVPAEAHDADRLGLTVLASRAVDGVGRARKRGDAVRAVGRVEAFAEEDRAPGFVRLIEDPGRTR